MKPWQPTMTGAEQPERLDGQRVSARLFPRARRGARGRPRVHRRRRSARRPERRRFSATRLWQRRFSRDRAIVGREITLDDDRFTVIGVMPRPVRERARARRPRSGRRCSTTRCCRWRAGSGDTTCGWSARLRARRRASDRPARSSTRSRMRRCRSSRVPLGIRRERLHREPASGRRHARASGRRCSPCSAPSSLVLASRA